MIRDELRARRSFRGTLRDDLVNKQRFMPLFGVGLARNTPENPRKLLWRSLPTTFEGELGPGVPKKAPTDSRSC